jgi:hypothetical protein
MKPDETWFGRLHAQVWRDAAAVHDPEAEKLAHSQYMRRLVIERFGAVPSSFWPHDYSLDFPDPVKDEKETRLELDAGVSGGGADGRNQYGLQSDAGGRLSRFEGRLALSCVHLWSNPGDVVFDPFAGRGARLEACLRLGRSYVGFDPSADAARGFQATLANHGAEVRFSEGSPGQPPVYAGEVSGSVAGVEAPRVARLYATSSLYATSYLEPASLDAVFTCPPYWCSEYYGDNAEGSEQIPTYGEFVEELVACLLEAATVLKPGRFMVVVVRGLFVGGHLLDLPGHVAGALVAAGLYLHDDIAKKMGTLRERFHQDVLKWRRTAQTHERVLVFWKPDSGPRYAFTGYHVAAYLRGKRRAFDDAQARHRRALVLARHGLTPDRVRPSYPFPEEYLDLRRKAASQEQRRKAVSKPAAPEKSEHGAE